MPASVSDGKVTLMREDVPQGRNHPTVSRPGIVRSTIVFEAMGWEQTGLIWIFGWMQRHRGNVVSRILSRPGYELQRVAGTREPSADELQVSLSGVLGHAAGAP